MVYNYFFPDLLRQFFLCFLWSRFSVVNTMIPNSSRTTFLYLNRLITRLKTCDTTYRKRLVWNITMIQFIIFSGAMRKFAQAILQYLCKISNNFFCSKWHTKGLQVYMRQFTFQEEWSIGVDLLMANRLCTLQERLQFASEVAILWGFFTRWSFTTIRCKENDKKNKKTAFLLHMIGCWKSA